MGVPLARIAQTLRKVSGPNVSLLKPDGSPYADQEILKQPQFSPVPTAQQIAILYAVTNGYLDDVPIDKVRAWEDQFHEFMRSAHPEILETTIKEKTLSDQTISALQNAITEFKRTVTF